MKKRIVSTIAQALLTVTLAISAQASNLYTVGVNATGNYEFGSIDTGTGTYLTIKTLGATMYSNLASQGNGSFYIYENGAGLRTIDTNGILSIGSATPVTGFPVVTIFTPYGMAYRSLEQKIYTYEYTTNSYGSIDILTGLWVSLGIMSAYTPNYYGNFAGRIAIHNGVLYGTLGDVTSVDTGFLNTFSPTGTNTNLLKTDIAFFDMVLASDGTNLYGITKSGISGPSTIYSIDPVSGSMTGAVNLNGTVPDAFTGAATTALP